MGDGERERAEQEAEERREKEGSDESQRALAHIFTHVEVRGFRRKNEAENAKTPGARRELQDGALNYNYPRQVATLREAGPVDQRAQLEEAVLQEAENWPNIPLQETFYRAIL